MQHRRLILLLACVLLSGAAGCRHLAPLPPLPPLPTQPWPGTREALEMLAQRARDTTSVSARCVIIIDPPDRGPVTLEGALASQRPDRFRVQAWKMDQKVLDLTVRGEEAWLWTDERAKDAGSNLPASMGATMWLGPLLEPLDPAAAHIVDDNPRSDRVTVSWPLAALHPDAGGSLVVVIDRPTLTIAELRFFDEHQELRQTLQLQRYIIIDHTPWPTRLIGKGEVDMDIRLDEIELNPDLPEAAFEPPAEAERRRK